MLENFFGGGAPSLRMSPVIRTTANVPFEAMLFVGSDMGGFGFQKYTSSDSINPVIYSYEENFESFTDFSTEGWVSPAGATGTIQVVSDPTGSGRSNVLELQDTITVNSDIGAVVYSPVIEALRTSNLTALARKTTIYLDFYFAGSDGRWFVIGKTSKEAFVMNDPSGSVDAYANSNHFYIPIVRNKWYTLRITINNTPGTYDVEVSDSVDLSVTGTITGKAFNTEDYDSSHFSGIDSSNGRLMFGSWFSYPGCPASSYGHVYIDNIKVKVDS